MTSTSSQQRLVASPTVAREARQFVDSVLTEAGQDDDTRETADLLTSEIVADAMRHGPTNLALRVEFAGAVIRVEVEEDLGWVPDGKSSRLERSIGRRLVDRLSHRWGSDADRNRTSTWFEVDASSS